MPTYDYKREDGTLFEHRQGINDQPLETCPTTGQRVTRMISGGAGVVYKGDGWYVKEYGSGSSATPTNGNGDSSTAASTSDSNTGAAASTKEK